AYQGATGGVLPIGEPIEASGIKGYPQLAKGIYHAATAPTLEKSFEGGTEAMQGLGETLNPLQYTMGATQPGTLLKFAVGQKVASGVADAVAEKAGLSPEAREFVSETSGMVGGLG